MKFLKPSILLILSVLFVLISSGCGDAYRSSEGAQNTPATSSQNTPANTPANTDTGNALIKTASVTVDGKAVTVLTDAKGLTLYYFTPDKEAKSACSGACAQAWPPLLYTGSGEPTAATKLPGKLEVYSNEHGKQVAYNTHLLYTYAGDKAAGETKGQGLNGKWFVATTDLKEGTDSSGGYSY